MKYIIVEVDLDCDHIENVEMYGDYQYNSYEDCQVVIDTLRAKEAELRLVYFKYVDEYVDKFPIPDITNREEYNNFIQKYEVRYSNNLRNYIKSIVKVNDLFPDFNPPELPHNLSYYLHIVEVKGGPTVSIYNTDS